MIRGLFVAALPLLIQEVTASPYDANLSTKILTLKNEILKRSESRVSRGLLSTDGISQKENGYQANSCDLSIFKCYESDDCNKCFAEIEKAEIDWTSVSVNTPCSEVVELLNKKHSCNYLGKKGKGYESFCDTFDSCLGTSPPKDEDGKQVVAPDCDKLESCEWEGMHAGFVGDGTCQDYECYNHKICKYDGGDCCEDTCKSGSLLECGTDGFQCRDPESKKCNPYLVENCENPDAKKQEEKEKKQEKKDKEDNPPDVTCPYGETPYRLFQYDSFGDGWDSTNMKITSNNGKEIYKGSLADGFKGTEFICLSAEPACYNVDLVGGVWGNEVTWEIKPIRAGTRSIAQGGSPMKCQFPVAGDKCAQTCDHFPTKKELSNDPEYKTYKKLFSCVKTKCVIQLGSCAKSNVCNPCLGNKDSNDDCYSNSEYNALVECSLCNCAEQVSTASFCENKAPDQSKSNTKSKTNSTVVPQCNSDQIKKGSGAAMKFSKCSNIDSVVATLSTFDQNNFGELDLFEDCAHVFAREPLHGGKKALECMNILVNAIKNRRLSHESHITNDPTKNIDSFHHQFSGFMSTIFKTLEASKQSKKPETPEAAISALAEKIYKDGENFCGCATEATKQTPACSSFINFKVLLYESLDACQALDEIDCAAWEEFHAQCKKNLQLQFQNIDLRSKKQCDYIEDRCGGAGPFPAFRRLDCDKEIPKQAWDFYLDYSNKCVKGVLPPEPHQNPRPAPSPNNKHKSIPYHSPTTPYVAPPDSTAEPSNVEPDPYVPEEKKHKHHFFLFFVLFCSVGAAGYWYKKRKMDYFDYTRYRRVRARNYGQDGNMFEGLSGNNAASSFEPPSLPPPPSQLKGDLA